MSKNELPSPENISKSEAVKMEVDKRCTDDVTTWNSHSEIEKRRRDKMNQYINDLATMVPVPPSVTRKPEKLTVLRLTVQHMKALQGSSEPLKETNHKPSFLSDDDLRNLITEASGGFLIVVECDRGQVLYVTDSVKEVLNISQSDMVRSNFYDLVHAKDTAKIKTQLSTTTTTANGKKGESADINISPLIAKSEENAGVLCPGAKRSFLCRIKKGANVDKAEKRFEMSEAARVGARKTKPSVLLDEKNHILTSFKGFLRAWPPNPEAKSSNESSSRCCLVAVVRAINVHDEQTDYSQPGQKYEFEARYRDNGIIISVDNSFTTICGYCPDEVVGKSTYSFIHKDDLNDIADAHHYALNKNGFQPEVTYRLRAKAGHYVPLRTSLVAFRNPWSKDVDYIISKNLLMTPIFASRLLISDKRMMEKQTASQEVLSDDDNYVFRESIRDLLRKLEDLDSSEGKSRRKRTAGTLTASKSGEAAGRKHTPDDIGVLIAEQAKKLGQENKINAHSGQYSNVALTQDNNAEAPINVDLLQVTSSRAVHHPMSDLNRLHGDNTIGSSTRMQNNFADTILSEQLAGIQDAINAMENTGAGSDDDDKLTLLVNVIENDEDLQSVLDDMPWNFI